MPWETMDSGNQVWRDPECPGWTLIIEENQAGIRVIHPKRGRVAIFVNARLIVGVSAVVLEFPAPLLWELLLGWEEHREKIQKMRAAVQKAHKVPPTRLGLLMEEE